MKFNTLLKSLFYLLFLIATTLNAKVTYTHTDALGSVIAESDESGKVIKSYHYAPYGESIPSVKNNNPGYTGHVYDNDLGLSYMKARYYDPEIGRFYSNDPVGFSADNTFSFNRYAYANNNPYKFVDPDGEHPLLIFVAVATLTSYLNAPDVGQQPMSGMTPEAGVALTAAIPVETLFSGASWMAKSVKNVTKSTGDWAKLSGQLKMAEKNKGNFGIGSGTREQAEAMGKAWVGKGYKIASDGKTLISANGLKQYRPPSYKPKLKKFQANFEQKYLGQKTNRWQSNAHLDIKD